MIKDLSLKKDIIELPATEEHLTRSLIQVAGNWETLGA